jgi:crotonobetainyl-CoA:carnitine CoA-transferase CaiB-like acyl-CoA transferase
MGVYRQTSGDNRVRINWPCADGYVNYMLQGGNVAASTRALFQWMEEDGFDVTVLQAFEWEEMGYGRITPEVMDAVVGPMAAFFEGYTREELTQGSLSRRILLFPVATPSDLRRHPQLEAREYYVPLEHSGLGAVVDYPGAFIKGGDGSPVAVLRRRAPQVGEHNAEIWGGELGLSAGELESLRRSGAI